MESPDRNRPPGRRSPPTTITFDPATQLSFRDRPALNLAGAIFAPGTDLRAGRALRRIFREGRFDAGHTHNAKEGVLLRLTAARTLPVLCSPGGVAFISNE